MADAFDPYVTPIDYFTLGGVKSPGIARIIGAGRQREVDMQRGIGVFATVAVWLQIAQFKAEIDLFTEQDWSDWKVWSTKALRELKPNTRNPASDFATDIWHPWLAALDIKAVIVKSVSQPELVDETGVFRITIEFIEYRKAKFTLSKPTAAKQKPKDWVDRRIDANVATIEDLNQKLGEPEPPKT